MFCNKTLINKKHYSIEGDKMATKKQTKNYAPDENLNYDLIIVGTGVAGYASAMYAGRLGLKTLIIGEEPGGTITKTHLVENYPGFISLTGPELAKKMEEHAKEYDIHILNSRVEKVSEVRSDFNVKTSEKQFNSKTIIFTTGSKWKKLGVPGEKEFENKGVGYCALCDGPLYRDKVVGIVGGSDSAVKDAILLTEYCKKVYIIYRKEKVRPEPINLERMQRKVNEGKIEVINNTNVVEIKGDKIIKSIILDKPYKGKKEFPIEGLFIDIGHIPLSELATSLGVKTNTKKEILINRNAETNVKGIFAAGDVVDTEFKQAITGVGEAVAAAYHAYEFVNKGK